MASKEPTVGGSGLAAPGGHLLILSFQRKHASTSLFFEGLGPLRRRVHVVEHGGPRVVEDLPKARALIVVRGLFEAEDVVGLAQSMGVPCYYLCDDNFIVARDEPLMYGTGFRRYAEENVRAALAGFEGVLLASRDLVEFFRERHLHDRLTYFPPIAPPAPPLDGHPRVGAVRIAFFGGVHRHETFRACVLPALRRVARTEAIELVVVGMPERSLPGDGELKVVPLPYEPRYRAAVGRLARLRPDVLVHPSAATGLNRFKNLNVLMNAAAVGAAPVLSDTPPYDRVRVDNVAVLCANDEESWYAGLLRVVRDRVMREGLADRVREYTRSQFSGSVNRQILAGLLEAHARPDDDAIHRRRLRALRFAETAAVKARRDAQELGSSLHDAGEVRRAQDADLDRLRKKEASLEMELLAARREGERQKQRIDGLMRTAVTTAAELVAIEGSPLQRLFRALVRRSDLWEALAPQFAELKAESVSSERRSRGYVLEASVDLRGLPFREYAVAFRPGRLRGLLMAFAVYLPGCTGVIGVEVISPAGSIAAHALVGLDGFDPARPARFDFPAFTTDVRGGWRLRVFARSAAAPVKVFELRRRRLALGPGSRRAFYAEVSE